VGSAGRDEVDGQLPLDSGSDPTRSGPPHLQVPPTPGAAGAEGEPQVGRDLNVVRLRSVPGAVDQFANVHRAETWKAHKRSELTRAELQAEHAHTAFQAEVARTPFYRHLLLPLAAIVIGLIFVVELAPSYWSAQAAMPTETQARVAAVFIDVCLIGLAWLLVRTSGIWRLLVGLTVALALAGVFVLRATYMAEMGMLSPVLNASMITVLTGFLIATAHYVFRHSEPWALLRRRVARWQAALAVRRLRTELAQHERQAGVERRAYDVYVRYQCSNVGAEHGDQAGGRVRDSLRADLDQ